MTINYGISISTGHCWSYYYMDCKTSYPQDKSLSSMPGYNLEARWVLPSTHRQTHSSQSPDDKTTSFYHLIQILGRSLRFVEVD